jgi:hypothetical protein
MPIDIRRLLACSLVWMARTLKLHFIQSFPLARFRL